MVAANEFFAIAPEQGLFKVFILQIDALLIILVKILLFPLRQHHLLA